jgi:DNA-binding NarL/FixJ family response regulator
MNQVRIVLADDHPAFRRSLRQILEREPDLTVVDEASDGDEAISKVEEHRPDLLLIDVRLPRISGLGAARTIT